MRKILAKGALWLALGLLAARLPMALAALPDPVTFSFALERGDIAKVRSWLDEGLDPEFLGQEIGSGLMSAAWYGNVEMMRLFAERGANPRRANRHGEQPLQLAAWNGHLDAVKWLLEHGAPLDRDGDYWGALHYAVFNGHQDVARYLVDRGANVNARSPNGSTPLMMAAREGREDATKFLLESGADTKARNDWGDTALTLAMRYDHFRLGKMISSPEEFEIAARAPREDFGPPSRSVAAPDEIAELLEKIREAEATGQPSEALHARLRQRIDEARVQALVRRDVRNEARRTMPLPYQPKSIVITARRNQFGGERAQITAGRPAGKAATSTPVKRRTAPAKPAPVDRNAAQARITDLMRQISEAEAAGRPTQDLRRQLREALVSRR